MSDDTRPGGEDKAWVDADRRTPQNAFDKDDGSSGQQYDQAAEAAQGRDDAAHATPRQRSVPPEGAPASAEDFAAPREP